MFGNQKIRCYCCAVVMETKARSTKSKAPRAGKALPMLNETCSFEGYDANGVGNKKSL
jgi:hypothetical protein